MTLKFNRAENGIKEADRNEERARKMIDCNIMIESDMRKTYSMSRIIFKKNQATGNLEMKILP